MKTIWKIAKAELNTLFCSPIAWLILIIFAFQAGLTFSDLIADQLRYLALNYRPYNLTGSLLVGYTGVYSDMQNNLYLYIPLLTMGLMSKEYSSGSIKLLYSSPITNIQIIIGKYISMIVYALILVVILFAYFIYTACVVENFDYSFALTGILGIFLLVCAYGAIGLFMSTLTAYQVVAAVGTLTILAVLNFMANVGQNIDFVRDLTYWLSLAGRSDKFLQGMICSEDVFYFIIVIALFLSLSILKLKFERSCSNKFEKTFQYVGVLCVTLLLGYVTSQPKLMCYYDATATKANTLTLPSQEVMQKMDGGLTLTTFVNLLDDNFNRGMPQNRNWEIRKFEDYIRFKPEMKMKYVYYYDHADNPRLYAQHPGKTDKEIAQSLCDNYDYDFEMFLSPEELKKITEPKGIDLEEERNRFVYLFERENGQKAFLRIYDDNQRDPFEAQITSALKTMVAEAPLVAFVNGHGERDIYKGGERDYSAFAKNLTFRHSLINQGFSVTTLDLKADSAATDIPENIDIIVIADVREEYTPEEIAKVQRFIARGGDMVITCEPRRQPLMNPLVANLGITFMPGIVVEETEGYAPNQLFLNPTETAMKENQEFYRMVRYGSKLAMPGAVQFQINDSCGFKSSVLFATTPKAWNELQTTDFVDDKPVINPETGERADSIPLVVRLSRQVGDKEQRIFVCGDADCMANSELTTSRNDMPTSNFTLISEIFRELSFNEFPVDDSRPHPYDDKMSIGQGALIWVQIIFMGLIPVGLLAGYVITWWRRRKK
ncbi:Gldg family protein [Bacteroides sp.]|uniref:Gldg family protein n=1 Tax=Bacteroides sp. TaxID=29523 RepID=UPI002618A7AF|nr:Gldg family protein [Bacteroides sp.]MDD3039996.1 Gldg family protein [Bacteroides sp.]